MGATRAFVFAGAVALGAVGACAGDGDETTSSAVTEPGPEPSCTNEALAERTYLLCTAGDASAQGLVVALHGRGSSAEEFRAVTALDQQAAEHGLAVVFPDALDGGWGDDNFTTPGGPGGDAGRRLPRRPHRRRAIRSARRRGARRPCRLLERGKHGTAVRRATPPTRRAPSSPSSGSCRGDPAIRPTGRVPLLEVFGTADPLRPYGAGIPDAPDRQAGDPTPTLSTPETVAAFVATAGGAEDHEGPEDSDANPTDGTRVRTERWIDRDGTIAVLETVVGGGHTWPSARSPFAGSENFGITSYDIDASAQAIAFLLDPDDPG